MSGWKPFEVGKHPVQRQGPKILTSCPGFNNSIAEAFNDVIYKAWVKIINNGGKVASHCKYCAIYSGDKALEGSGRGSLMSTSHLDSEVDTDLEEVGHDMENNRNTARPLTMIPRLLNKAK